MNGYILESRSILESDIWNKPPMFFKVWHYLLMNAQHTSYRNLKRGQLFTSIDQIREACSYHVGYRKVTPSRKEIYGVLEWLRNPHEGNNEGNNEGAMITTTKVTHGMLVNIVNYDVYQDPKTYEGNKKASTKVTTKERRRSSQGNNKNKNVKNIKNDNNFFSGADAQKKIPPDRSEVDEYCLMKNYHMDVDGFMTYYNMNGWTLSGGRKISDWKSAVDYWHQNGKKIGTSETKPAPYFEEFEPRPVAAGVEVPFKGGLAAEMIRRKQAKHG